MDASQEAFALGELERRRLVEAAWQRWRRELEGDAPQPGAGGPLLDLGAALDEGGAAAWRGEAVALRGDEQLRERLAELRRLALEIFEEHGVGALYLAVGVASWRREDRARSRAAALLLPVALDPDLTLRRSGAPLLGPTLRRALETCAPDLGGLDPPAQADDPLELLRRLRRAARGVPGFYVRERWLLGTLSPHAELLAQDLLRGLPAAVRHDVLAALAGDGEARARIARPRREVAADAALVLDADQEQRRVVADARAGRSCRVHGAPGTGKSQTAANLAAALAADGQGLLLVAAKRAALDDVRLRLERQRLGHLAVDVREALRDPAGALDRALRSAASPAADRDRGGPTAERRRLEERLAAAHRTLPPTGLSAFDAWARSRRLPRLPDAPKTPGLELLGADAARHVATTIADAGDVKGLLLGEDASPWTGAAIADEDEARRAFGAACDAREAHGRARAALRELQEEGVARAVASAAEVGALARLVTGVLQTMRLYRPEIWRADLPLLEQALAREPGGLLGWARDRGRRTALRALRRLRRTGQVSPAHALREVQAALEQARAWQALGAAGEPREVPAARRLAHAVFDLERGLRTLQRHLGRPLDAGPSFAELGGLLEAFAADVDTPHQLPRAAAIAAELRAHGAEGVAYAILRSGLPQAAWSGAFERLWLEACVAAARRDDPLLGSLTGREQDDIARELERLRRRERAGAVRELRRSHRQGVLAALAEHPEQAEIVRRAAGGDGAGLSLGALLRAAPDVLLALWPCWLASPYDVHHLAGGTPAFDVALCDEAGRLPLAAAVPALLRARAVVAFGDPQGLGPALPGSGGAAGRASAESLYEALRFLPELRLGRHYRSQDEALFDFVNREGYGGAVQTFPGRLGHGSGLRHVRVGEGSDPAALEARRVAELALRHAEEHPDESLGIVCLGEEHADRVRRALAAALASRGDRRAFFDEARAERCFVKPAALVSGEARDAVILTLGYGPDADGGLSHRLGPLGEQGGERQLFAALLPARRRLTVVTALPWRAISAEAQPGRGIALLRSFLQFAEMRSEGAMAAMLSDAPVNPLEEELDAFQEGVYLALRRAGMDLVPQYGALRHRLDFAARHPERPGEHVLAILCDAAERHGAPSEREADRLRHMAALGWAWHRIWAADWAEDQGREVARAMAAYRQAASAAERLGGSGGVARPLSPVRDLPPGP